MKVRLAAWLLAAAFLAPATSAADSAADSAEVAAVVRVQDAVPAGPSLAERLATIRERIQRALVYPPLARSRDTDGSLTLRFEIDAGGVPRNVRVTRSSGSPRLDRAALRAVEEAGRLPRVHGPLEVPVQFELAGRR